MSAPQRIGSYRVVSQLGSGATGVVYLAVQDQIARQVAIKVLHAALATDDKQARRFLNEARAVNIVRHPALVQVSDFGQTESGRPYIVMEFLQGQTLRAELTRRGRLPAAEVLGLVADIADALAAAHHHRIVHRDLKPENVMLVPDPAVPRGARVKLLDFGVAKLSHNNTSSMGGGEATAAGALLGTPTYMAPEQVQGASKTTDRADVYALGIMAYELLCGQPPFTGPPFAVLTKHVQETPVPLSQRAPEVGKGVAALVHRMLAKAPEARPSMKQVAQLLATELSGAGSRGSGSLAAFTPPEAPRARWLSMVAGGGGFLATLALLAGGLWWAQRGRGALGGEAPCPAGAFCLEAQELLAGRRLRALSGARTAAGLRLWAVGDQGTVLRGEGGRWTQVPIGEGQKQVREKLSALWLDSAERLWVAGADGLLLRRDDERSGFVAVTVPNQANLHGLWRGAALWVSTKDGALLRQAGDGFQAVPTESKRTLYGVSGVVSGAGASASEEVFSVGREGVLLRCQGGAACQTLPSGVDDTLYAVAATPTVLWLAGKSGTLLRHDREKAQPVLTHTVRDLKGLWLAPDGQLWAVGEHGTVLRVNTAAQPPVVTQIPSGTTEDLDGVFGAPAVSGGNEIWAVGTGGTLLHYRP